jgi:hypothetical protein
MLPGQASTRDARIAPNMVRIGARDSSRALGRSPLFVRGWQSTVNRSLNIFTLIGYGRRRRLRWCRFFLFNFMNYAAG